MSTVNRADMLIMHRPGRRTHIIYTPNSNRVHTLCNLTLPHNDATFDIAAFTGGARFQYILATMRALIAHNTACKRCGYFATLMPDLFNYKYQGATS